MLRMIKRLWAEEEGQALAEYGLILALIAVVAIGALFALGKTIDTKLKAVDSGLTKTTD
jgi:pilus assembly protein Flp/PilA